MNDSQRHTQKLTLVRKKMYMHTHTQAHKSTFLYAHGENIVAVVTEC